MAHTLSAKKRVRQTAKRTEINRDRKSRFRTCVRKVEEAIASGNKKNAQAALRVAESEIMKVAQTGVLHRNAAARKISRLSAQIKKLA